MLEQWMNDLYHNTQAPTISIFFEWSLNYLKGVDKPILFTVLGFMLFAVILYSKLMQDWAKGVFIIGVLTTIAGCAYYVLVFQGTYPREQVIISLGGEEVQSLLQERPLERHQISGLIIQDVTEINRQEFNFLGVAPREGIKKITFTIKTESDRINYSGYGYVKEAPEGTKKAYVEYYTLDTNLIDKGLVADGFFGASMYNVTVYQKKGR